MELKIQQQLAQKQQMQLTQELTLGLQILNSSNAHLEELILEEVQKNPFLSINFPKSRGFYIPPTKSHLEFQDEILSQQISTDDNLFEEMKEEIKWMNLSGQEKWIAEVLISSLNKTGELLVTLENIQAYTKVSLEKIEKIFELLRKQYPLIRLPKKDFIENYLEILFENEPEVKNLAQSIIKIIIKENKIQKDISQVSLDSLNLQIKEEIQKEYSSMSLKEIALFQQDLYEKMRPLLMMVGQLEAKEASPLEILRPDIVIELDKVHLTIKAKLYDDFLPEVSLNTQLLPGTQEDKSLLKNAQLFLGALEKRKVSLIDFIELLIRKQSAYFFNGEKALLPLSMKEVANSMGLHPSTITRMTQNKHFYLEGKIFPLRLFFTKTVKGIKSDFSRNQVLKEIEKVMRLEEEYGKVSDIKLKEILANKGILLARRTVNKYRNLIKNLKQDL